MKLLQIFSLKVHIVKLDIMDLMHCPEFVSVNEALMNIIFIIIIFCLFILVYNNLNPWCLSQSSVYFGLACCKNMLAFSVTFIEILSGKYGVLVSVLLCILFIFTSQNLTSFVMSNFWIEFLQLTFYTINFSKWVMMNQDTRRLQKVSDDVRDEFLIYCPQELR